MIFVAYYLFHEHLIRKGDMNLSIFATELFLQYWWMHQQNVEVFPTPNSIIRPRYALEPPWDLHVKNNLTLILIYLQYTHTVLLIYFLKFLFRSRRFPLPVRRRISACSRLCWSWYVEGDSRCRRHLLQEQNVRVSLHWWCRHLHSLIRIWLLVTIHCRGTASPPLRNLLKLFHLVNLKCLEN